MKTDRDHDDVPARLREGGDADARALIDASDALPVPAVVQQRVRVALDERLSPTAGPRGVPRWAIAMTTLLLVGTAVAAGLSHLWPSKERLPPAPAPLEHRAHHEPVVVPIKEPPAPPVPQQIAVPAARAMRSRPEAAPAIAEAPRPEKPTGVLDWPLHDSKAEPRPQQAAQAPAAAQNDVMVDWQGRRRARLSLTKANDAHKLVGVVNDTRVKLTIEKALITGHIGEQVVNLWIRGERASGSLRGHDSGFFVQPIDSGHLVRGEVPGHSVRVEIGEHGLRWYPGCEEFLVRIDDESFAGQCAGGEEARVSLSAGFMKLPYVVRLILLGMLLPERDQVFDHDSERLFPPLR